MSRSRKKPVLKGSIAYFKNKANRKIRRTPLVPNGKNYKKIYESYKISDWHFWNDDEKSKRK